MKYEAEAILLIEVADRILKGESVKHLAVTSEAQGALRNGTRVVKIVAEPGDYHAVGAQATVRGSLGPLEGEYGYFVEWDDLPNTRAFVRGSKLGTP